MHYTLKVKIFETHSKIQDVRENSFKEDLGADSLDLFELVMSLEDTYGVEIPSEELEQLTTVESVVDYLKQKGVEA